MQFGVSFAANLLALTWIAPVAQVATVLRDFTLIDGTGRDPVSGPALVVDGEQLRIRAAYCVTAVQVLGTHHAFFDIRAGQRNNRAVSDADLANVIA